MPKTSSRMVDWSIPSAYNTCASEVTCPGNIMARGKGKGARKALKAVSTPVTMRKRGAIRELSLAGVANCIIDKALEVGHRCVQGG